MVILLIFTLKIVTNFYLKRKLLFRMFGFWMIIDIIIVCLSFGSLGLVHYRERLVKVFLDQIEMSKHNTFINYFHLFRIQTLFIYFGAFLICIATIRLWKLLRFLVVFRIMERTVMLSLKPVFAIFIWHLIITLMFTFPGVILFGSESKHFKTVSDTMITLLLNFVRQDAVAASLIFGESRGEIYYVCYMFVSMCIYATYVSIIILSHKQAKREFSNIKQYTLKEYLIEKISVMWDLLKFKYRKKRVRGGQDEPSKRYRSVYPKSHEHRYSKCITISKHRLKQMNLITQCVLMNKHICYIEMLNKLVYNVHSDAMGRQREIFFIDKLDKDKFKVIDDYRMLQMEHICSALMDTQEQRNLMKEEKELENREQTLNYHETELNNLKNYLTGLDSLVNELEGKIKNQ